MKIFYMALCIRLRIPQAELFQGENKAANEKKGRLAPLGKIQFTKAKLSEVTTALIIVLKLSKYSLPSILCLLLLVDSQR